MKDPIDYETSIHNNVISRNCCGLKWGLIWGGWLVATAVAFMLYILGSALGLSSVSITDIENLGKKSAMAATLWLFFSWIISLYLGNAFASSAAHDLDKRKGWLNGVAVWAIATVLTVLVGIIGLGTAGILGMNILKDAGGAAMKAGTSISQKGVNESSIPVEFQAQIKENISKAVSSRTKIDEQTLKNTADQLNAETLGKIGMAMLDGDSEAAKSTLAINTSLSRPEIDQVMSALSEESDRIKMKLKTAAEKMAAYTAAALWASFIVSLVSLGAAILGGIQGTCGCGRETELIKKES